MTVIDIHTHMIPRAWLDLLQQDGGGYELKQTRAGQWRSTSPVRHS